MSYPYKSSLSYSVPLCVSVVKSSAFICGIEKRAARLCEPPACCRYYSLGRTVKVLPALRPYTSGK